MEALRSVPELQQVLLEEMDASQRARAHLELSWIAVREGRRDAAVKHLREAVALDHRLHQARRRLRELGESSEDFLKARTPARGGGPLRRLRQSLGRRRER
ncbi:MAG: hypothetical protein H6741_18550 [Alphaproteobacteria bacterium]|nr:hypothetical protein [Alphaproteobacteria bacterium]MCB9794716.1 hypothetical protein [Alphaproteobacteria bacterium]